MSNPFQVDTIFWLMAAFFTLYYSDIVNALKIDPRVDRNYLYASIIATLIPLSVGSYFIGYLSFIKKVHSDDWERHTPYAIPIATASAIVSGVLWNIALWGVYGFMTPIILSLLFMGFVMAISVLPPWKSEQRKAKSKHAE